MALLKDLKDLYPESDSDLSQNRRHPLLTLHLIPSNFQRFYTLEDNQTVVLDEIINQKFKEAKERADLDWKSEEVAVIVVEWITSIL